MNIKHKADLVYVTGSAVVLKEHAKAVMEELKSYQGIFYADIEINEFVIIEKA